MARTPVALSTPRLSLRSWSAMDRGPFARMNADPEVMRDLGGPIAPIDSDRKADRFTQVFEDNGFTRWVIELAGPRPRFIGYCGIVPSTAPHPLGQHFDIGWRLVRAEWGHGYASEAAAAALVDGFTRVGLEEVFACTSPDNSRSQAVMGRLGLTRRKDLDFTTHYDDVGPWKGLVWSAEPTIAPGNVGEDLE